MCDGTPLEQERVHSPRRLWNVPKLKSTGIVRTEFGWRAYIRVRAQLYAKRFPPTATQTEMQDWRAAQRVDALRRLAKRAAGRPRPGTFAEDIETYLKTVRTMPTYAERQQHLEAWLTALGNRPRAEITATEIRTVLQQWRIDGKRLVKHAYDWRTRRRIVVELGRVPLSESACNHRRTALMHLFTVLDGKSAANPVKDVPKFREPDPEPHGIPLEAVSTILAAMPDSATKARCSVIAWTGLPHASLMQIREEDLRWQDCAVYVQRRRKGKGTKGRVLPLLPEAMAAFKLMRTFDAWGRFSRDSLRRSLHRACDAIGVRRNGVGPAPQPVLAADICLSAVPTWTQFFLASAPVTFGSTGTRYFGTDESGQIRQDGVAVITAITDGQPLQ